MTRWRSGTEGALGLVSGLALPVFYVAYLNRDGPRTVCTSGPHGGSCIDEWSPWPFVAVGFLFLAAGPIAFVLVKRREEGR
jgi:hypothetical protein